MELRWEEESEENEGQRTMKDTRIERDNGTSEQEKERNLSPEAENLYDRAVTAGEQAQEDSVPEKVIEDSSEAESQTSINQGQVNTTED